MTSTAMRTDFADAARGLLRRPLRSLLSSLGIGIGVTALITMLAISEGAGRATLARIDSLGLDTLRLERVEPAEGKAMVGRSGDLFLEEVSDLQNWLGSRGVVGAFVRQDGVVVSSADRAVSATVIGVNIEWFAAEKIELARGRSLDQQDLAGQRPYAILGSGLASQLQVDPLATLRYGGHGGQPVSVVGVAVAKGRLLTEGTGLSALDFDTLLILPISAVAFRGGSSGRLAVDGLVISLHEPGTVLGIAEQLETLLQAGHRQPGDFRTVVPLTLLDQARESQRLFAFIMGAIAGLSLLVGGIGVMNIMLANIAEQTREIGLRLAVGASPGRIVSLYLANAVLLTFSGGLWGVVSGVLLALVVEHQAGWEVYFSPTALLVAPMAAIFTGLLFGLHPAVRAAALNPAQALRDT